MPKKTLDNLVERLRVDIRENYKIGDRFITIRDLAVQYKVSLQSAQKAMQILKADNMVLLKPKAGTVITSLEPRNSVEGKSIAIFSNLNDPIYDTTFLTAIRESVECRGMDVVFHHVDEADYFGLEFAEYVLGLCVNSGIFLSYTHSALSLYHLYRENFKFVSDIRYEELPMIPTVQTDNFLHAREAGQIHLNNGFKSFVMVGYQSQSESVRYKGYLEGIGGNEDLVRYIQIANAVSISKLSNAIHYLDEDTAVFCADFPLNDMVASKFHQYKIPVRNDNLLVYDCAEDYYNFHNLPPVRSVAPGIKIIAEKLCEMIIKIIETDTQPVPSQILI